MLVLGLDFESTGLDTQKEKILEIGSMLYDTDSRQPMKIFNTFIRPLDPLPEGYISPTGIKAEWLIKYGMPIHQAFGELQKLISDMPEPIILGHNFLNYDKPLAVAELNRNNIIDHGILTSHIVDTRQDVPFPNEPSSRRLIHLSAEFASFVNPFEHRALFDVCSCFKLIEEFDFAEILAMSKIPLIKIRALTGYEQRQLAKDARFSWDGEKKMWSKDIRENALEKEKAAAAAKGFEIVLLN